MREFIYYSSTAPTSGSLIKDDLMKSGRLDIAIHTVIAAFFLSHDIRRDVKLHLVFDGPPNPTMHLEFKPVLEGETGKDKIYLNKKDISKIIKQMLYRYKEGQKNEVFPGYWIEKKSLTVLLSELVKEGKKIFYLDKAGKDIRSLKLDENSVFLLGDHQGNLPSLKSKELKRIKYGINPVSIGPKTYFASQTVAIVNNELDRQGI
jgi:tRNA (pseudouridine54-N1)-methyltransferase